MPPLEGRDPGTVAIARHFDYRHVPPHLQDTSYHCTALAEEMIRQLPDGPELLTGLMKLLEAKECFVRAALDRAEVG